MGRGRGKGKRFLMTSHEDDGESGEDEKIPIQKRRGRAQKPLNDDEIKEDNHGKKTQHEEMENTKNGIVSNKEPKSSVEATNLKKRKRSLLGKEKMDPAKVGNGFGNDPKRPKGFRQNGSRRKSKPRRAAEAGVECN